MNKMILIVVIPVLALPALASIDSARNHRFEKVDNLLNIFNDRVDVCLATSDSGAQLEPIESQVEEMKVLLTQSGQSIVDETTLLKEALLESQANLGELEDLNNRGDRTDMCWLQDSATEKIEVNMQLTDYLGDKIPSGSHSPSVDLQLDVELDTRIPC